MTRRWPWGLVAGYSLVVALGQVLESLGADRLSPSEGSTAIRIGVSAALLVVAVSGAAITASPRKAPAGPLLLALAGIWAATSVLTGGAAYGLQHHWSLATEAAWLAAPSGLVVAFLIARLLLGFPDGPTTRKTRIVARAQVLALALGVPALALGSGKLPGGIDVANPHQLHGAVISQLPGVAALCFAVLFLTGLGAIVELQRRRRKAQGESRQALTAVSLPMSTLFIGLALLIFGPSGATDAVAQVVMLTSLATLGVAMAVAILRYRLYTLDIVLERSVVLLMLVAAASAAYVLAVLGVGAIVGSTRPSYGLSVVATTGTAVALLAVQRRAVGLARRVVYGRRATPYEALAGFARQVSTVLSLDRVLPATAEAAWTGTGARTVRVEVTLANGTTRASTWPPDAVLDSVDAAVDVVHEDEVIGRLLLEYVRGDRPDATRERLLADLAHQAALAIRNVRLAADLEVSIAEVQASRLRIVEAQDHERRRVERDLHDGAQQRLVQAGLTVRMATDALSSNPEDVAGLLAQAGEELRSARTELRELARGIHPAVLTEAGLAAAVESLAERASVPVTVTVATKRMEPALESAAYFVVAEALTNIAKHAQASSAQVAARVQNGMLLLSVCDDGRGGADPRHGTGLQGLRDRVSAVNGVLRLSSPPSGGTELVAEIPCVQ